MSEPSARRRRDEGESNGGPDFHQLEHGDDLAASARVLEARRVEHRGTRFPSRGSNTPSLQKSADGSVDVYSRAHAPTGRESNWVPTNASGQFEVLFRLYGPEKPFFDKT
jgi:hypothetical protein